MHGPFKPEILANITSLALVKLDIEDKKIYLPDKDIFLGRRTFSDLPDQLAKTSNLPVEASINCRIKCLYTINSSGVFLLLTHCA